MEMTMNVCQYRRGGECVWLFIYTYAGIRIIDMHLEKEERHISSVMRVTSTKVVSNIEQNTKHAARATHT